jgi:hypothetical protein
VATVPNYTVVRWFLAATGTKCTLDVDMRGAVAAVNPMLIVTAAVGVNFVVMIAFVMVLSGFRASSRGVWCARKGSPERRSEHLPVHKHVESSINTLRAPRYNMSLYTTSSTTLYEPRMAAASLPRRASEP